MNNQEKNILLAEDEVAISSFYSNLLRREGFQVDIANDGAEAYDRAISVKYDLMLLDLMMPKMGGIDVLKRMTEVPGLVRPTKIVLLTNLDESTTIAEGMNYGIDGYMVKSDFSPPDFLKEVKGFLSSL